MTQLIRERITEKTREKERWREREREESVWTSKITVFFVGMLGVGKVSFQVSQGRFCLRLWISRTTLLPITGLGNAPYSFGSEQLISILATRCFRFE